LTLYGGNVTTASREEVIAKWIAAAKAFGTDPRAKVLCPRCATAPLAVTDATWPDGSHVDRYMSCPMCGEHNVLTITTVQR
jgi:hypothetical protein